MAQLFATYDAATTGGSGVLVHKTITDNGLQPVVFPARRNVPLPTSYRATARRPNGVKYKGRLYLFDWGTDNLVFDEHHRSTALGILAPTSVPTIAATAGGAVTGSAVGYVAFYDELANVWSPLSGASAAVALVAQGRAWSNLPTTTDPRVTHIGLYVSMDGALPRLAAKRTIGTTSTSEGVATLTLGDTLPTFGIFDRAGMGVVYKNRLVVAGMRDPTKLHLSATGAPERRDTGLEFTTHSGEPITALIPARDVLLVMCPSQCEVLRAYNASDFVLEPLHPAIGCFNQRAWAAVDDDYVMLANRDGIWMWNGAWHRINNDDREEYQRIYSIYPVEHENGFAAVDPDAHEWTYWVSGLSLAGENYDMPGLGKPVQPGSVGRTCSYNDIVPEQGGGYAQPAWNLDAMSRNIECAALLRTSDGRHAEQHIGNCDGYARKKSTNESSPAYADDDSDFFLKTVWVRFRPEYPQDPSGIPGGGIWEGHAFIRVLAFVQSDKQAWTVYMKAGDEEAYKHKLPTNSEPAGWHLKDIAATLQTGVIVPPEYGGGTVDLAAQSVHDLTALGKGGAGLTGRALTLEFRIPSPAGIDIRGYAIEYGPGGISRGPITLAGE